MAKQLEFEFRDDLRTKQTLQEDIWKGSENQFWAMVCAAGFTLGPPLMCAYVHTNEVKQYFQNIGNYISNLF